MLRLLLGRSGFGKTYTVLNRLEELARLEEPGLLILLVPEQFSLQANGLCWNGWAPAWLVRCRCGVLPVCRMPLPVNWADGPGGEWTMRPAPC